MNNDDYKPILALFSWPQLQLLSSTSTAFNEHLNFPPFENSLDLSTIVILVLFDLIEKDVVPQWMLASRKSARPDVEIWMLSLRHVIEYGIFTSMQFINTLWAGGASAAHLQLIPLG